MAMQCSFQICFGAGFEDMELHPHGARGRFKLRTKSSLAPWLVGFARMATAVCLRQQFAQHFEPLWTDLDVLIGRTGQVAAGLVQTRDKPDRDRIYHCQRKDDREWSTSLPLPPAPEGVPPPHTRTATLRSTRSAARAGNRLLSLPARAIFDRDVLPSVRPPSAKPPGAAHAAGFHRIRERRC